MDPTAEFRATLSELMREYCVPDIVLPTADCLFILESPHVQELRYGAPVSGSSGATMSRHIFGEEYGRFPLGLLVKKNADEQKNRPRLNRIGLMNVCNVPMQASAYPDPAVRRRHARWLKALGSVRTANHKTGFTDPDENAVQQVLVQSLRDKLVALQTRACTVVPCGRFAQKFFRLAGVSSPLWTVIDDVPHPSYNSWDRQQYAPVVTRIREAISGGPRS